MNSTIHKIERCRICGNSDLRPVVDLGTQALTGIFPRQANAEITSGPLELVRCHSESGDSCGLVQLRHSYPLAEMYGENYGYRSSLNRSMVQHLQQKVDGLRAIYPAGRSDLVLDIGSNDGTTLACYPEGPTLVGIDPTAAKFRDHYRNDAHVIAEFFSADAIRGRFGGRDAKIITSIAMLYDLEDPQAFFREVARVLHPDAGVWHFEQSYLPAMLRACAYDTICHEHLEYYSLRQIEWLADRAGLKIIDIELNDVNGGSFAVTAAHRSAKYTPSPRVKEFRAAEESLNLSDAGPYTAFARRVLRHRNRLASLLSRLGDEGKTVAAYGASTKGNVILQYCSITPDQIAQVAEVNADKFGCFTPGTRIPIVSETEAKAKRPDYFLVLPWHFRKSILIREAAFLEGGGRLIFPLPEIEIVGKHGTVCELPDEPRRAARSECVYA